MIEVNEFLEEKDPIGLLIPYKKEFPPWTMDYEGQTYGIMGILNVSEFPFIYWVYKKIEEEAASYKPSEFVITSNIEEMKKRLS